MFVLKRFIQVQVIKSEVLVKIAVIFNPFYTLDDESNMPANLPGDLGAQFTEIFTKKHENVSLLLSLLEVCLLLILKCFLVHVL